MRQKVTIPFICTRYKNVYTKESNFAKRKWSPELL